MRQIPHAPTWNRSRKAFLTLFLTGLCTAAGCHLAPFGGGNARESQGLELNREGITAFEREDFDTASDKFAQAIRINENDLNSRRYYAEILWRKGKQNEAVQCLADAAVRDGTDEEKLAVSESLAEKFLEANQPTAAVYYAEKVIDLAPKRHEGWELRAMVYQRIGKQEEALANYHRALQLAPNDRELIRKLALFQSELGNENAALAAWEELGRFYPDHSEPADVLRGKADVCRRLGRVREAADYYAAAAKQEPENPEYRRLLAEMEQETQGWRIEEVADRGTEKPE